MRILLVSSTFPPESTVSGRMALDVACHLVSSGHEVKVVCPYPTRPMGVVYEGFQSLRGKATRVEQGVTVVRVPSFTAPASRLIPRMIESWSFGRWARRVLSDPAWKPDVLYDDSWPMLAQAQLRKQAARLGIPRVGQIMDLYPESAFARVPKWVLNLVHQPLMRLDARNAAAAAKLIVISESMRVAYETERGIAPDRLEIIHTWQDEEPFRTLPRREEAGQRYGVRPDRFTCLYLGNIGPVAGVEHLIHSFAEARLEGAQLVIVGEGSQKQACMRQAAQTGAAIQFVSDPQIDRVPLLQALADVALLPVKRGAAFSSIPSKLSGYMLSAKPVLASVDQGSETARLIGEADCGWVIEPEDTPALVQAMQRLARADRADLEARGARGRDFAMEHLSKSRGVERLSKILLEAARRPVGTEAEPAGRVQSANP